ncbi:site-specific tyrosine recombinase [Filimonas lacunae]|nr:site-specific tyrosine recombinase [Filimonas lacunae]
MQEHIATLQRFITWAEGEVMEVDEITYQELLAYIQYEQSKGLQQSTLVLRLQSLKLYYDFLKVEGVIDKNPVRKVHLKGGVQKVVVNPLDEAALEKLYADYEQLKEPACNGKHALSARRNVAILGLMVFQGVHSGEISSFEPKFLQLREGRVSINGTKRSNERVLPLTARQMIGLHSYLELLPPEQEKLFDCNARNAVYTIMDELKGINPVVQNAAHIRSSVILNWLRKHNKRQVQYMAGHKYITSTEHYEQQELTKLTSQLERYHPLS